MPDIRIIVCNYQEIMAMMRYPNPRSEGKANLSLGAYGLSLSLKTGAILRVYDPYTKNYYAPTHIGVPTDFLIPQWNTVLEYAKNAAKRAGLRYAGMDLTLAQGDRPVLLEMNARPGLMIQNVTGHSLRPLIRETLMVEVPHLIPSQPELQNAFLSDPLTQGCTVRT